MSREPRTYYEAHAALEKATSADEARAVVSGFCPEAPSASDELSLMRAFIDTLCRCNGTTWRQELL